jgi:DNA-binding GntR family transcriptional regulator
MNVEAIISDRGRRTAADTVFDAMRKDIVSLKLEPGAKLSEIEVARRFAVSRQPVREAFIRLDNMHLVQVRPQRATTVCKMSARAIVNARFIRTAVEVEIMRLAVARDDGAAHGAMEANLIRQAAAVDARDADGFKTLDMAFHRLFCVTARTPFAFQTLADSQAYADRFCSLALSSRRGLEETLQDHVDMLDRLKARDEAGLIAVLRLHLRRLEDTVAQARAEHPEFFED